MRMSKKGDYKMKSKKIVCPKCGNALTFYTKEKYKGTCNFYFRTDGKEAENGCMYENATHKLTSQFVFCNECDSKVGKVIGLLIDDGN